MSFTLLSKDRHAITVSNRDEQEAKLADVGAGEVLGEVSLIAGVPHSATVTALEPVKVITIERDDLLELMERSPELGVILWQRMAQALAARLQHSNDRYVSHVAQVHDVADMMLDTGPLDEAKAAE